MPAPKREFLLQLLRDARITGPQLEERVTQALDLDYWRGLVPGFHVCAASPSIESASLDNVAIDEAIRGELEDGYFRLPGIVSPAATERINRAIDAVIAAGWPPAFVFVYDEAWQVGRAPGLAPVLEAVLGAGYSQICHVWAHVVKPVVGATGWSPHTDGHTDSTTRGRMSVWVGLTDATLDNGCMHVVPRRATESSPDLIARFNTHEGHILRAEVALLLHASHALVTSPGDALGWGFDIIHWGGFVRRAGEERRGFSFEYLAASAEAEENDGLITSMERLPDFDIRMRSIATAVISYRRFEPMVDRYVDVAKEIKSRLE